MARFRNKINYWQIKIMKDKIWHMKFAFALENQFFHRTLPEKFVLILLSLLAFVKISKKLEKAI